MGSCHGLCAWAVPPVQLFVYGGFVPECDGQAVDGADRAVGYLNDLTLLALPEVPHHSHLISP